MDMAPHTFNQPSAEQPPPAVRRSLTVDEEVEELMASVESETLPRALDLPESWKQFAGRLRARFRHRAAHHN
jgi:hypothetical protein